MLEIQLYQNNNENSKYFGKVYGRVKNQKPIGIPELAKHMAEHNTPFSSGVIKGVLDEMTKCIKELMLLGQPVKLDDLAIFKASVQSAPAKSAADFDLSTNIRCVKLCAIATGIVTRAQLTKDGTLSYTDLSEKLRIGKVTFEQIKDVITDDDNQNNG